MMRHLIGLGIQLPVAQLLPCKDQSRSFGRAFDLGFEQGVDALIGGKCRSCLIPLRG